jgi:hypothetical protein
MGPEKERHTNGRAGMRFCFVFGLFTFVLADKRVVGEEAASGGPFWPGRGFTEVDRCQGALSQDGDMP